MAYDGTGNFTLPYLWVNYLGQVISAVNMDTQFSNIIQGFNLCLTRDGQGKPSTNLDWNGFRLTNMGAGIASTDAATVGQVSGISTGNVFRKNLLTNGGFDVWQVNPTTTGTSARVRTADCWWAVRGSSATGYTVSRQTGARNRYALKWQRDSGNTSTASMQLAQSLETADSVWMAKQLPILNLSFFAKSGANYSGGQLTVEVIRGTGTDQNVLDSYTGATVLGTTNVTLSSSLTQFSLSTIGTDISVNEIGVKFTWTPTGTAGADDSVTIENVQLERASAATDFEFLPFEETLRRCQRYVEKSFAYSTVPAQNVGISTLEHVYPALRAGANSHGFMTITYRVLKRYQAVVTIYNPAASNSNPRDETASVDCVLDSTTYLVLGFWIEVTGNASTSIANKIGFHWLAADAVF